MENEDCQLLIIVLYLDCSVIFCAESVCDDNFGGHYVAFVRAAKVIFN